MMTEVAYYVKLKNYYLILKLTFCETEYIFVVSKIVSFIYLAQNNSGTQKKFHQHF